MNFDAAAVLAVALIHLAGVMSPGPNFIAVVHRAVTGTRAEALMLVLGIATVAIFYALASMLGVGLLLALFPGLALALKVFGALYLIWFGLRLWRHADAVVVTGAAAAGTRGGLLRAWRDGMLTNLANVKSIAFFTSVFAAAIPPQLSPLTMAAMVAAVFCNALLWYGAVALLLSTPRASAAYRRARRWIDRVCGVLLMLFAARLLADR
jgi:threonine efflux protein